MRARCQPQPFVAGAEPPVHIVWCVVVPIVTAVDVTMLTGWTLCGLPVCDGWSVVSLAGPPCPGDFCTSCVHAAQTEPRWRAQGWG